MILSRIQNYLQQASRGKATMSRDLVEEFKEQCGHALERQFNAQDRGEFRVRMSSAGKPLCQAQLSKLGVEEDVEYNLVMKFLFGDLIEAAAIAIMKASGITVEDEQKEVSLDIGGTTVVGHMDAKIDGKVYDIKSASPFAFDTKFGNFGGYMKLKEDDPFGYVAQGYCYAEADDAPFGGWIVVNKVTGEWVVCDAPEYDKIEKKEALDKADASIRAVLADHEFQKLYPDHAETLKPRSGPQKGETIVTGNRIMAKECGFCGYKKHCWPEAEMHRSVVSNAKNPPFVWYSKLKKREL